MQNFSSECKNCCSCHHCRKHKKSFFDKIYKRPEFADHPKIYFHFKLQQTSHSPVVPFRVQDVPTAYFESALDMMEDNFIPTDTLCIGRKLHHQEESRFVLRCCFRRVLHQKFSLGCFTNDGIDDFIGVIFCEFRTNKRPHEPIITENKNVNAIMAILDYAVDQADIFYRYNVDIFLLANAFCIRKDFIGKGIRYEMLAGLDDVLKALNINIIVLATGHEGTQQAAIYAGFEEVYSVSYERIEQMINFDSKSTPSNDFKVLTLGV